MTTIIDADDFVVNLARARDMVLEYIQEKQPVFVWGPPGIGKSDMIRQVAKYLKRSVVDYRTILRDPVDLRGLPTIDVKARKTTWLTPDDLPNEKKHGKKGILFLDELNAANQQVQAACFGLVLDRRLGDYVLPDGWDIVAAGNRQSDRSAAQRMPRALANRFAHIEVEPDLLTWIQDFALENCHPMTIAFLRLREADMFHNMNTSDERVFPTPRSIVKADKHVDKPDHIRRGLIAGHVGLEYAGEFEGFVRTWRNMPDLDEIIKKPKSAPLVDEPSTLYALSTALGRKADRNNLANIMLYMERIGPEYEIVVMMDATLRDQNLCNTKAYIEFTQRHKDVQLGRFSVAA